MKIERVQKLSRLVLHSLKIPSFDDEVDRKQ